MNIEPIFEIFCRTFPVVSEWSIAFQIVLWVLEMFYKIRAFDRWQSQGLKSISRDYMQENSHFFGFGKMITAQCVWVPKSSWKKGFLKFFCRAFPVVSEWSIAFQIVLWVLEMFYKIRAFDRRQSQGFKSISRDYMQGNSRFFGFFEKRRESAMIQKVSKVRLK